MILTARSVPPTSPRTARESYLAVDAFEARRRGRRLATSTHRQRRAELERLARTHRPLGSPDPALAPHPSDNAATEAQNLVIKNSRRLGFGSQLRELSTRAPAGAAAHHGRSPRRINTTPPTTHHRVEPAIEVGGGSGTGIAVGYATRQASAGSLWVEQLGLDRIVSISNPTMWLRRRSCDAWATPSSGKTTHPAGGVPLHVTSLTGRGSLAESAHRSHSATASRSPALWVAIPGGSEVA